MLFTLVATVAVALAAPFLFNSVTLLVDQHRYDVAFDDPRLEHIANALNNTDDRDRTCLELSEKYHLMVSVPFLSTGDDIANAPQPLSKADILAINMDSDGVVVNIYLNDGAIAQVNDLDYGWWADNSDTLVGIIIMLVIASVVPICLLLLFRMQLQQLEREAQNLIPDITLCNNKSIIDCGRAILQQTQEQMARLEVRQQQIMENNKNLLASVAHEFRTPLARLQFANEMAMERTGEDQQELFEEANSAAAELDRLVRETLNYSRLNHGDTALSKEPILINSALDSLQKAASFVPTHLQLEITLCQPDTRILADQRMLLRALTNLVSNATRYARSVISVAATVDDTRLHITVTDDGPGIPLTEQERVFEPFYRLEPSRCRESGGFGLGLSIVRSICENHGASISVESSQTGCCFGIYWPIAE